ncbi:MAG TPA: EamA family transporter [Tepidiformaceae bacterium]|nr:EamA family transporter [Tepidiformaceae bacterium]
MTAILGGLGAATFWAAGTLCSSRSSRLIGAGPALAWVMLIGLAALSPFLFLAGTPVGLGGVPLAWMVVSGAANLGGLVCIYTAFRIGKVSIIAPVASAEGAFAAVLAVAAGEQLAALQILALAVIAAGIAVAAASRQDTADHGTHSAAATLLAVAAAATFGLSLYSTARASSDLPVAWVLLPARLFAVAAIAAPLALTARLRLSRQALPLLVVAGLCEVLGLSAFAIGSRHGVAVTSVLGSQFAALAAVAAYFLFNERLARLQLLGVAATVLGVAWLSALQA